MGLRRYEFWAVRLCVPQSVLYDDEGLETFVTKKMRDGPSCIGRIRK